MSVRFEGRYEISADGYQEPIGKLIECDPGQWLFESYPDQTLTQSMLRDIAEMIDKLEESGPVMIDRIKKDYEDA